MNGCMLARGLRLALVFVVACLYHSALSFTRASHVIDQAASITEFEHGISAIDSDYVRPLFDAIHLIIEFGYAAEMSKVQSLRLQGHYPVDCFVRLRRIEVYRRRCREYEFALARIELPV